MCSVSPMESDMKYKHRAKSMTVWDIAKQQQKNGEYHWNANTEYARAGVGVGLMEPHNQTTLDRIVYYEHHPFVLWPCYLEMKRFKNLNFKLFFFCLV